MVSWWLVAFGCSVPAAYAVPSAEPREVLWSHNPANPVACHLPGGQGNMTARKQRGLAAGFCFLLFLRRCRCDGTFLSGKILRLSACSTAGSVLEVPMRRIANFKSAGKGHDEEKRVCCSCMTAATPANARPWTQRNFLKGVASQQEQFFFNVPVAGGRAVRMPWRGTKESQDARPTTRHTPPWQKFIHRRGTGRRGSKRRNPMGVPALRGRALGRS